MKVIDFTNYRQGTLVKFSAHYLKTRVWSEVAKRKIGVVTEIHIETDPKTGQLVAFPFVHFEGQHGPSMVHPLNLKLYRKPAQPIRYIETEIP